MAHRRLTQAQRKRHREAADWVLRKRDAELSPEDLNAFREWLDSDPENRRAFDAALQLLGDARTAIRSDPALNTFEARPARPGKAAAGTLLGLTLAAGLFLHFDGPMRLQADVISGTAEMPVVELDDGSTIHLNAESAIAVDYSERSRSVRLLRGEAFFEVASDPARPFTVEADMAHVTALGTAFDVRLGSEQTEVTVTHNAVLVAFGGSGQKALRLNEGEHLSYGSATGSIGEITAKDAAAALAWRRGVLVLDNAPLSHVIEEIERHFAGRIVIAGSGLASRRISGTIDVSNTLAAIDFIEQALDLRSTKVGPFILLRN